MLASKTKISYIFPKNFFTFFLWCFFRFSRLFCGCNNFRLLRWPIFFFPPKKTKINLKFIEHKQATLNRSCRSRSRCKEPGIFTLFTLYAARFEKDANKHRKIYSTDWLANTCIYIGITYYFFCYFYTSSLRNRRRKKQEQRNRLLYIPRKFTLSFLKP